MGLSRELQQERVREYDPSRGGSHGYDILDCLWMLEQAVQGHPNRALIRSLCHWQERLDRYRRTGNQEWSSLVGVDQLLLVPAIRIYPDSNEDKIATFIYNEGGGLYPNSTIFRPLKELNISRKLVSTEAYQAFTPINLFKVELFWTRPPPLGVRTIPRQKFIDVDEFGVELNRCNRMRGWTIKSFQICKAGHYS
jgi:hypothetical protein